METSVSIHSVKGMSLYGVRRIVGLPSVLSLEIQIKISMEFTDMSRFIRSAFRQKAAVCYSISWFIVDGLNPAHVPF